MQAVDLNSLLEGAADSGDDTALQQLLEFSVKPSAVVELVRRRRDETKLVIKILKIFTPLLNFEEMKEDLFPLCAQAIDEQLFTELCESLPSSFKLSSVEVSTACGTASIKFEKIPEGLRSESSFLDGLIAADNLELFLPFEAQITQLWHYMTTCGRKCARRIMAYYLTSENIEWFLRGAFLAQNKDTLSFVRFYPEEVERSFFAFADHGLYARDYYFAVECVRERLVVLSEDGWQRLKATHPGLYEELQNDV